MFNIGVIMAHGEPFDKYRAQIIGSDTSSSGIFKITTTAGSAGVSYTDSTGSHWHYPADFPQGDSSINWPKPPENYPYPNYDYNKNNLSELELAEIKKELNKLKKKLEKKEIPMKHLFEITVVDLDGNIVIDSKKVVATDENEAQFGADIHAVLKLKKLQPKDVSIVIRDFGQVRSRPEPKKVIVEKEK